MYSNEPKKPKQIKRVQSCSQKTSNRRYTFKPKTNDMTKSPFLYPMLRINDPRKQSETEQKLPKFIDNSIKMKIMKQRQQAELAEQDPVLPFRATVTDGLTLPTLGINGQNAQNQSKSRARKLKSGGASRTKVMS